MAIGLTRNSYDVFVKYAGQPQGMILLCGPTGSGKSTTLYAALRHRLANFPGRIITVDVLNSSSGTLGAITWGSEFKLAGAFTNPAKGKRRTISFRYHQSGKWIEIGRAAADI